MKSKTEAFYWGESPHRLFMVVHLPVRPAHTGLVFCPPFAEEMLMTYERLARWAKELAEQGIAVLRFHAHGTGESDGTSADFTLKIAGADAVTALSCLRQRTNVGRLGFFGLRLGGTVAVQAAAEARPDFLLLWSPITDLRQYFKELLRLRLTKELVHQRYERISVSTRDMVQELDAGRCIDLLGYDISPEFYRQLTADSPWPDQVGTSQVLWIGRPAERVSASAIIERWRGHGCRVNAEFFPEPVFWEDYSFPQSFATASCRWLEHQEAGRESS